MSDVQRINALFRVVIIISVVIFLFGCRYWIHFLMTGAVISILAWYGIIFLAGDAEEQIGQNSHRDYLQCRRNPELPFITITPREKDVDRELTGLRLESKY